MKQAVHVAEPPPLGLVTVTSRVPNAATPWIVTFAVSCVLETKLVELTMT